MITTDKLNKDFQILELDQRANNYLKEVIEQYSLLVRKDVEYSQYFLQQVLQEIDLTKGRVTTCLPKDIDADNIYDFEHAKVNTEEVGGLLSKGFIVEREDTSEWLIPIFKGCLESNERNAIIFKNIYSLPTDPFLSEIKEKILTTKNEVFYFLTQKDNSVEKIKSVMKISDGAHPPLFAVCSVLSESLNGGGGLSGEEIKSIINNINCIVISAYDGDSYLVWSR